MGPGATGGLSGLSTQLCCECETTLKKIIINKALLKALTVRGGAARLRAARRPSRPAGAPRTSRGHARQLGSHAGGTGSTAGSGAGLLAPRFAALRGPRAEPCATPRPGGRPGRGGARGGRMELRFHRRADGIGGGQMGEKGRSKTTSEPDGTPPPQTGGPIWRTTRPPQGGGESRPTRKTQVRLD